MMLKELYQQIQADTHAELIQAGEDGLVYATRQLHLLPSEPQAEPLEVHSLTGFVDYCKSNRDIVPMQAPLLLIHVVSPTRVDLIGSLYGRNLSQRNTYCKAHFIEPGKFSYGRYLDQESMIIALLSQFDHTDHRADLMKLIGNLKTEAITTHIDDGVTQRVTAMTGVARVAEVDVPNPVSLKPFRTFAEIEQPESLYVFRLQGAKEGKPQAALFNVEDNRWQLEAIEGIKAWLAERIPDIPIIG